MCGKQPILSEFTQVVQRGELVGKHRRIEGNQNIDAKLVVRQDNEGRTSFFILDFDLMLYDIVIFRCVLFHDTGFLNLFTEKRELPSRIGNSGAFTSIRQLSIS